MARVEIPWTVLDENSRPLSGVAVSVTDRATGDPVTCYSGETGGTTTSPVSDSLGRLNAWVPPGAYLLTPAGGSAVAFDAVSGQAQAPVFRTAINFLIGGVLNLTDAVPDALVPKAPNTTVKIVGVYAKLEGGTSAVVTVRKNGAAITNGTVTATQAGAFASPAPNVTVADGDRFDVALGTLTGAPTDLTVSLIIEHTI